MSNITKSMGTRIRNYRTRLGLSQEKLAELADCHPTYIGQIERGEKNATIESIEKISSALNISLSQLFEKIEASNNDTFNNTQNLPLECYDFMLSKKKKEQEQLLKILIEIDKYKNI